ncbi:MAG: nitroreductase family deazaflavin-dependent oxidoreductase [Pseudomonadales bacterium]
MGLLNTELVNKCLNSKQVIAFLKAVIPPLDIFLLRISKGHVNVAMQCVALLETIGAKSGQKRLLPLLCMPVDKGIALVASNWGQARHPAWYFNLKAMPEVNMTFRGYKGPMKIREVEGDERAALWIKLVEQNPQYARYQQKVERVLPVIVLERP